MKLRVRNNWGNYDWTLDGSFVDVRNIDTVTIDGWDYNVRAVRNVNTVYDQHDLEIESDIADVRVWVSLYKNPELLTKVTDVSMVEK